MGFFSKLNPNSWFGSALSGGASLIGNIVGNKQQNANIDKQIAFQREENEKARAFNKAMAEQANQWSIDQWNRENQYNSPEAMRQRLRDAGVNADLFYGGNAQNTASSSPSVTPVAPATPTDVSALGQKATIGDITNNVVNQSLAAAQIRKLGADTGKSKQETENLKVEGKILSADALTRAAQNEQALEIGRSTVYVNHSIGKLNHKEAELASARITEATANANLLYEKAEEVKATIRNVNASTASIRFGMMMRSKEFRQRVAEFQEQIRVNDSSIRLNYEQAATYLATRAATVLNINADTSLKAAGVKTQYTTRAEMRARSQMYGKLDRLVQIQGDQAAFNLDSDKTYKNLERGVNLVTGVVDSVSGVIGSAGSFISGTGIGLPKPVGIKGLRK
nr:MAG TPA: DNA pilot protein VP2 [Microviridae sp.]